MSDVVPSTTVAVICRADGCGNRVANPCGHSVCRRHAPCAVRHSEGTYWSREECDVCSSLWEKCISSSRDVKKPALTSLKSWVAGFSRNTKGPYLDSELSRAVLFPGAKESAVFGYSSPAGEEEQEDVSLEDEDRLLREPSAAASVRSEEGSVHSEMEVEPSPSLAVHPSPAPSVVAPPPAADPGTAAILAAMAQMQETLKRSQESFESSIKEMKDKIHELESGSPAEIPGLPLSQCPPTSSGNPWVPVGSGRIEQGMFKLSHQTFFKLENVEFYPSQDDFPRCYYRLNSAAAGNKIPAETVILHQAEASSIVANHAPWSGL